MASFKKKGSSNSTTEINVVNGLSKDSNQTIRLGGSLVQEETSIVPDVNNTRTLRFGTFSKLLNLLHSATRDFYAYASNVLQLQADNILSLRAKNACFIKSEQANLQLTGNRGILLEAPEGFSVTINAGYIQLNNGLRCDQSGEIERLFLSADEVYLSTTRSSTDTNFSKRSYFMYDLDTDRLIYGNGSGKFNYVANLDDLSSIGSNPSSSSNTFASFFHNHWLGSNMLLKTTGTNVYFHTVKQASTLQRITINIGDIGANSANKNITFVLYKVVGNNGKFSLSSKRTIASLQNHAIFSITTKVSTVNQTGYDFQKVVDNINIPLEAYSKLYMGITTNQLSSLNNLSITVEY